MDQSIIEAIDMGNNTDAKSCQTHSMMLEFIMQKSISENVITLLCDQSRLPEKVRRLSVHSRGAKRIRRKSNIDLSHVRSLTIFGEPDEHVLKFGKYKLLRVLDLEECESLNDEHVQNICDLLLLRYLSLGGDITTLPKDISKLKFLETLDLRRTKAKILLVPVEVIMLPCLIHLLGVLRLPNVGHEMMSKVQASLSENSYLETLAGFVANEVLLQMMYHMKSLTKVKLWFPHQLAGDASSNCFANIKNPIQEYIQRGTDLNGVHSLSLSFEGSSQGFMDFPLKENSYYLSSLKLHGELRALPSFVTKLGGITELCLQSPSELSEDVLAAVGSVCTLHYLKLIATQMEKFIIEKGAFGNLRRLSIMVQSMTSLENQEGAMPQLESLCLRRQNRAPRTP